MVCLNENVYLKRIGAEKHVWTSGCDRQEHVYSYRRQEFQSIFERKLFSCFGQLLLIF